MVSFSNNNSTNENDNDSSTIITSKTTHNKKRKSSSSTNNNNNISFQTLNLHPSIYRGITKIGFRIPTPVQRKSLPILLTGIDTVVMARTGSGKTAAFVLPILQRLLTSSSSKDDDDETTSPIIDKNTVRAVILSPTRELALQTLKVTTTLASSTHLRPIPIIGGTSIEKQFTLLSSNPDIIIATPGRLQHHLAEVPDFNLHRCEILVLDEADRLFEMGFSAQIREIVRVLPGEGRCQKCLFSATMPKSLVEFSSVLNDPEVVRMDNEVTLSEDLRLAFFSVRSDDKDALLLLILRQLQRKQQPIENKNPHLTLIFAATRHHVDYIHTLLTLCHISCTKIYGTMDTTARTTALSQFRQGKTPLLIVTDVAARGIDVPLVTNVIHYHLPCDAKLFVHRCGRAGRVKGRKGWCFGLCDPGEVSYLVDLHAFLGCVVTTCSNNKDDDDNKTTYDLEGMDKHDIHVGSLPEMMLDVEREDVKRALERSVELSNGQKVAMNAMKQFKRSRSDASKEGLRKAKALLEEGIPTHPLIDSWYDEGQKEVDLDLKDRLEKREDFLAQMRKFRPKETIFEASFTKKASLAGPNAQMDKNKQSFIKDASSGSTTADVMKGMRRQMKLATDKAHTLVVAGSEAAEKVNLDKMDKAALARLQAVVPAAAESSVTDDTTETTIHSHPPPHSKDSLTPLITTAAHQAPKRGLTKAQRKALKKGQTPPPPPSSTPQQPPLTTSFRDPHHYISHTTTAHSQSSTKETLLQPSSSQPKNFKTHALTIQKSMLDIMGDENADLVQRHRIMRWDKSKRKYVQTTVGREVEGMSMTKRIKLESGTWMKTGGKDNKRVEGLGELYEKWQKKTKKSIGRVGVLDDDDDDDGGGGGEGNKRQKGGGGGGRRQRYNNDDNTTVTSTNSNNHQELKNASQIRKARQASQKLKIKNMPKDQRKRVISKIKDKAMEKAVAKGFGKKGYQGKKGMSGRWSGGGKRKRR